MNSDFRYTWKIDKNQSIVSCVAEGIVWAYGNTNTAPYSEQFYIGGVNSVHASTTRNIGPGGSRPTKTSKGLYLDQTGDIRMEVNVEYRFRIYGDLHGAVFLDVGNVWMLREDDEALEKQLRWKTFGKQIALGTGTGSRYDLSFLILRLDCGVPLYGPYDTGKKGYYNVTGSSWKELGVHFAVGYSFQNSRWR